MRRMQCIKVEAAEIVRYNEGMKRVIDFLMAGAGLGMMLLASAIKMQKFGGDQFNLSSGETTIMLVAGVLMFILATASLKGNRR